MSIVFVEYWVAVRDEFKHGARWGVVDVMGWSSSALKGGCL